MFIFSNMINCNQVIGYKPHIKYIKTWLRVKKASQEKLLYGKYIVCEDMFRAIEKRSCYAISLFCCYSTLTQHNIGKIQVVKS